MFSSPCVVTMLSEVVLCPVEVDSLWNLQWNILSQTQWQHNPVEWRQVVGMVITVVGVHVSSTHSHMLYQALLA